MLVRSAECKRRTSPCGRGARWLIAALFVAACGAGGAPVAVPLAAVAQGGGAPAACLAAMRAARLGPAYPADVLACTEAEPDAPAWQAARGAAILALLRDDAEGLAATEAGGVTVIRPR